jgi:hypothetical protein
MGNSTNLISLSIIPFDVTFIASRNKVGLEILNVALLYLVTFSYHPTTTIKTSNLCKVALQSKHYLVEVMVGYKARIYLTG